MLISDRDSMAKLQKIIKAVDVENDNHKMLSLINNIYSLQQFAPYMRENIKLLLDNGEVRSAVQFVSLYNDKILSKIHFIYQFEDALNNIDQIEGIPKNIGQCVEMRLKSQFGLLIQTMQFDAAAKFVINFNQELLEGLVQDDYGLSVAELWLQDNIAELFKIGKFDQSIQFIIKDNIKLLDQIGLYEGLQHTKPGIETNIQMLARMGKYDLAVEFGIKYIQKILDLVDKTINIEQARQYLKSSVNLLLSYKQIDAFKPLERILVEDKQQAVQDLDKIFNNYKYDKQIEKALDLGLGIAGLAYIVAGYLGENDKIPIVGEEAKAAE